MFEPRKKQMNLNDYLRDSKLSNTQFTENDDYIIFCDRPNSRLKIFINKIAYYTTEPRANSPKDGFSYLIPPEVSKYFDMMTVSYRPPFIPVSSTISMMLGQYCITEEGPSFFLTEPKSATHALFYNLPEYPAFYRKESIIDDKLKNQSYIDDTFQAVPLDFVFETTGKIMLIAKSQLEWEKNRFMKNYQVQFFHNLNNFYTAQA